MPKYTQSEIGQALKAIHDQNHMDFSALTERGKTVLVVVSDGKEFGLEWWGRVGMVRLIAGELKRVSEGLGEEDGEEVQCLRG